MRWLSFPAEQGCPYSEYLYRTGINKWNAYKMSGMIVLRPYRNHKGEKDDAGKIKRRSVQGKHGTS